jgi:hypothetical protein
MRWTTVLCCLWLAACADAAEDRPHLPPVTDTVAPAGPAADTAGRDPALPERTPGAPTGGAPGAAR